MDKEKNIKILQTILQEMFEVEPNDVKPEALLYDDLDIDSIDAVDLIAKLSEITGVDVEPEQFKSVATIGDVITILDTIKSA